MLRTLICASALIFSGAAFAEEMPATPMGMEIRSDDGQTMGRVASVGRNAEGRIISIGAEGLEAPAEAPRNRPLAPPPRMERLPPYHSQALVAMNDERDRTRSPRD